MVLAACRSDYLQDAEQRNDLITNGLITKIISLNESTHKTRLLSELSNSKQMLSKHPLKNALGKTVNFGDSISINTDQVIYIENGPNYHTYTFAIDRNNPQPGDPVENLLLSPLPDGTYQEFLVKYNFTEQEKEIIRNDGYVDRTGKVNISQLTGQFQAGVLNKSTYTECTYQDVTVDVPCRDPGGAAHMPGESCKMQGSDRAFSYTINILVCSEKQDPVMQPSPDPGGTGGGGGGGTPTTNPDTCATVATSPNEVGIVDENGCITGIPTQPNVPRTTPCEKTKTLMQRPEVQAKVTDLKQHTGPNEKGYKFMKDGTPPQEAPPAPNGNYSIYVGDTHYWKAFTISIRKR